MHGCTTGFSHKTKAALYTIPEGVLVVGVSSYESVNSETEPETDMLSSSVLFAHATHLLTGEICLLIKLLLANNYYSQKYEIIS